MIVTSKLIPQESLDKLQSLSKQLNPNHPDRGVIMEMVCTLEDCGLKVTGFDLKYSKSPISKKFVRKVLEITKEI